MEAQTVRSNVLVSNALNFELEATASESETYDRIRILEDELEKLKRQIENKNTPTTSSCTISTTAPKAVQQSCPFADSLGLDETSQDTHANEDKFAPPSCTNSSAAALKVVHSSNSSSPPLAIIETPRSSHATQSLKRATKLPPRKFCINQRSVNAKKSTSRKKRVISGQRQIFHMNSKTLKEIVRSTQNWKKELILPSMITRKLMKIPMKVVQ